MQSVNGTGFYVDSVKGEKQQNNNSVSEWTVVSGEYSQFKNIHQNVVKIKFKKMMLTREVQRQGKRDGMT